MLVVRAPFNLVWQRLPGALEKVGMKVTDSTRSQGSMALTYKPVSYTHLDVYKRQLHTQQLQQLAQRPGIRWRLKIKHHLRIDACLLYTSRCV